MRETIMHARSTAVLMFGLLVGALTSLAPVAPRTTHAASLPALAEEANCSADVDAAVVVDAEEQAAVEAINAIRAGQGLDSLHVSPTLSRAAQWKAEAMAAGAPMAHDDAFRTWVQRLADCGVNTHAGAAENLARGTDNGTVVVQAWVNSPAHYDNVVSPVVGTVGLVRVAGPAHGWYWAAVFGNEADAVQ
jgi:uncharacterized protein YkwD